VFFFFEKNFLYLREKQKKNKREIKR